MAAARTRTSAVISVDVLNSTRVMGAVLTDQADLGFIEAPGTRHGLADRVVATDQLILVVGRDHPWARRRRSVGDRELADTRLVHREVGSGTRETLEVALSHLAPLAPALGDQLDSGTARRRGPGPGSGWAGSCVPCCRSVSPWPAPSGTSCRSRASRDAQRRRRA